jgi:hypothetical protein
MKRNVPPSWGGEKSPSVHLERPAPIASTWVTPRKRSAEPQAKGSRSMSKIRFVGLDVHADTLAVAVVEPNGEVRSLGVVANRPESVRKLIHRLGPVEQLEQELQAELQCTRPTRICRTHKSRTCKVVVNIDAARAASGPLRVVEDVEGFRAELEAR